MIDAENQILNEFIHNLTPGKIIDLQFGGLSGVRMKPVVIGIDLGRYILVKFPNKLNHADYKDILLSGSGVVVRYILEGQHGECVAFSTSIKHVSTIPEKLIFLNYPTHIENRQLRTSQRKQTHIPAQIAQNKKGNTLTGNCIGGYIVDISARGCLFSFKAISRDSGVKKCPVHIAITRIGVEEPLLVNAHIKNNRFDNGNILVGIMFDESSLKTISLLLDEMAIEST
ncbi:hypothetical protein GCM10009111_21420 [Colwellia asteriadis]|uniref:PilZ domain-containing protein n=1 Tax=Colwellia asteriadis TaxID=517723 RepID=A0ABN1L7T8_9GAMM